MSVGELARRAGVAPSSVRFYESLGLITASRTRGGQRRYAACALETLSYVAFAKSAGFTLSEISALLSPPEPGEPLFTHWRFLAERKLTELDEVVERAEKMKLQIRAALDCRCTLPEECGLVRPSASIVS